jgi:UPF0716 protein FxsA
MKLFGIWAIILIPFIEIWGYFKIGSLYGWWYMFYIFIVGILGWRMIKEEKANMISRMMGAIGNQSSPIQMILGAAKNMIAGGLFLFPGVFTDFVAVTILLIPGSKKNIDNSMFEEMERKFNESKKTKDDDSVIEGEYKKEDDK